MREDVEISQKELPERISEAIKRIEARDGRIAELEAELTQLRAELGALRKVYGISLTDRVQLTADLKTAREALEKRQRLGHHDTCDSMKSAADGCSCGYDEAKQALAQITREETVEARSH